MSRQTNPWAAISALCIGFFMIMLDTTIVSVAIPSMITGLRASLNEIFWVNSIYLLTYAVPLLLTGRLGDRFGPKRVYLAGLAVFTAASLWCGLAGSPEMLITARGLQGIGAAMMTPQTLAVISNLFAPDKRGGPMGMWGAVAGAASIAGPVLGGVLVDSVGWQWIFFVNVPIGVIGLVLAFMLVPDLQPKRSHRYDFLGIALSSLGLLAVIFGLQNGQRYDWGRVWGSLTVFEIIGAGVLLLGAFVLWQARNKREPLLPLGIFGDRMFSFANLTNIAVGFTIVGMFPPLVIYAQSVLGLSPLKSGLLLTPMSLIAGVVAPIAGRWSDRVSGSYVVAGGLAMLGAGIVILVLQVRTSTAPLALIPALLACGIGIGLIFAPLGNMAMKSLPPRFIGAGSGIFNTSRQFGGVIGSAAVAVLLQARLTVTVPDAAADRAAALPPEFREEFVSRMTAGVAGGSEFGVPAASGLPSGVPAEVADRIRALAVEAFNAGYTQAARQTLLLPVAVLLVGVFTALGMRRSRSAEPVTERAAGEADVARHGVE
jgi:EmrB/QacA subfamily drug resistance transporter